MTPKRNREGLSPLFLLLAGVTLALSSWGYFQLLTDFADMPDLLAVLAVGGVDLAAVLFGKHALTVAEDGDSSLPWNLALLALTGLGAGVQFAGALLAGDPIAVGLVLMVFPIVTVLLFEGQLRRRFRLQGRRTGRVPEPRVSFDLLTWIFYRALATRALKLSVLDRGLTPDEALMVAEAQLAAEALEAERPVARRRLRRTYAVELANGQIEELDVRRPAAIAGPAEVEGPDVPDTEESAPVDVRRRGEIAAAVRTARADVGDELADVLERVRMIHPAAERETVRRTLGRLLEAEPAAAG